MNPRTEFANRIVRQNYIEAVQRRAKVDLSDSETNKLRDNAGQAYYQCSVDAEQGATKKLRRLLEGCNKRFSCFEDFADEALRFCPTSQLDREQ